MKQRVLILCTANSARSQMAEGSYKQTADSGDVNRPFRRDVNIVGAKRRWYLHDAGEYSHQSRTFDF